MMNKIRTSYYNCGIRKSCEFQKTGKNKGIFIDFNYNQSKNAITSVGEEEFHGVYVQFKY